MCATMAITAAVHKATAEIKARKTISFTLKESKIESDN